MELGGKAIGVVSHQLRPTRQTPITLVDVLTLPLSAGRFLAMLPFVNDSSVPPHTQQWKPGSAFIFPKSVN